MANLKSLFIISGVVILFAVLGVVYTTSSNSTFIKNFPDNFDVNNIVETKQSNDFYFDVGMDIVPETDSVFKFGRNPSLGVTEEVIWDLGGGYTFLNNSEYMEVVSNDPDDTLGGTGAWNLIVYGLDENFDQISEVVLLNGTTPVITQNKYLRVFRAFILNSGNPTPTLDANEGTITITSKVTGYNQAGILPTNGQTLMAVYTIPRCYTGYVTGLSLNIGQGKQALFKGKFRNGVTQTSAFSSKYVLDLYQDTFFGDLKIPLKVPEKTDMVITGTLSSTPETTASASFGIVLVKNEVCI